MRKAYQAAASAAVLLGAVGPIEAATKAKPAGLVDSFEITSRGPAYGGAVPAGAQGPYEVITAIARGKLDPAAARNAPIVDLKSAPLDADGMVSYSTDVVILRPVNPKDATRTVFYDVVNRGNKIGIASFIGGGALNSSDAPPATFPSLLRRGVTIVWSGWQGDIPQTGNASTAATGAIGTAFPTAVEKGGGPITGLTREEYIPDYAGGAPNTIVLSYPPADPAEKSSVTFTARQSWMTGYGTANPGVPSYDAPSVPVAQWQYAQGPNGATTVTFTPPANVPGPAGKPTPADAGTIYSFVYKAKNPRVNGVGFAALRDLMSFLRYDSADAHGHANPLADLKQAACALPKCAAQPTTNFDVAVGEGISQSGRFIKEFLYRGFNEDSRGHIVFDGLMPIIAGARQTWTDARFSQPGRWSKEHEDHWQFGDQFPFTYGRMKDPVSGRTDGLLAACSVSHTCPRIVQTDGEYEWWGARASLVVTDGKGHDIKLPDNVRYYLVPGTQHGGGPGVTTGLYPEPAAGGLCQLPGSPVTETPVWRALAGDLIDWVAAGKAPPPSQYPTVAAGTLVAATMAGTGFPDLSDILVPYRGKPTEIHVGFGIHNQLFVTNYAGAVPAVSHDKAYTVLVPKVDANGNATTGVIVPDTKVPLATYTGWNLRGNGHAVGDGCTSNGAAIPLAINAAARTAGHDSRSTLADLYSGRADYQKKVAAAASALVQQRYLLQLDADNVFAAQAKAVSPDLIPNP